MFFRRVFAKKDNPHNFSAPANGRFGDSSSTMSPVHINRRTTSDEKQKGLSVLQLTPLWEHIIRTSTLPEGLNIGEMFEEFSERLHDPEWQVRQHALRVLVDVLSVMRQSADVYAARLMPSLVENLGHPAPAVRKGALDAIRVHIAEAAMPETAIIEIIELGMEQKLSNENFTGRLAVGVILALPALIQPALMTVKRNFILRSVLHALSTKMIQITYQEVALKSILKIRDLIGPREFHDFMPYNAKREFELLCNVYGLTGSQNLRDSGIDLNAPSSTESKHSWHNGNGIIKMNGYAGTDPRLNSSMKVNGSVKDIESWHLNSSLKLLGNSGLDMISDNRNTWQFNTTIKETRNSGTDTSQDNMSPELNEIPEKLNNLEKKVRRQNSFVKIIEANDSNSETWSQVPALTIKNSRDDPSLDNMNTYSKITENSDIFASSEGKTLWDLNATIKPTNRNLMNEQAPDILNSISPGTDDFTDSRSTWSMNNSINQNNGSGVEICSKNRILKRQSSFIKIESDIDATSENTNTWTEQSPISILQNSSINASPNNSIKPERLLSPSIIQTNNNESGWQKSSIDKIYENVLTDVLSETKTSRPSTSPVRNSENKNLSPTKIERGKSAGPKTTNSRKPPIEVCWKNDEESEDAMTSCPVNRDYDRLNPDEIRPSDKVIMETEIQLSQDTALTMRILEQQNSQDILTEESEEETSSRSITNKQESARTLRNVSDSEMEDTFENDDATPRTPRRVRFGGEIVKMRTPDSDTLQSDADDGIKSQLTSNSSGNSTPSGQSTPRPLSSADKTQTLNIEIPNDNTKPVPRPKTAGGGKKHEKKDKLSPKSSPKQSVTNPIAVSPKISPPTETSENSDGTFFSPKTNSIKNNSPNRATPTNLLGTTDIRSASASPRRQKRKFSGKLDAVLSPTPAHREVQVLHNLGRSPSISPTRARKNSAGFSSGNDNIEYHPTLMTPDSNADKHFGSIQTVQTQTSYKLPVAIMDETNGNYELNSEITKPKQWEDLGIVNNDVIYDLKSGDWRLRSRAFCAIEESLKNTENLALVQPCLDSLLRTLLSSEKHPDVCEDKRRILSNLISRLPLDNLENRVGQIVTGLCRQGGAGSNRVAKSLMQRLPPAAIVLRLLSDEFLHARSSRFRENALQMVLYALMTFPSTYFDISTCVGRATKAAIDRKKRVRQAALDVLAVLGQISSPKTILDIVNLVVEHRKDGDHLNAAVKARLARKQLPIVGNDGSVQYSLRIPSPHTIIPSHLFGADIEWIIAGSGSVSPTSIKKRSLKIQQQHQQHQPQQQQPLLNNSRIIDGSKRFTPHEMLGIGVGVGVKPINEYSNTINAINSNTTGNWTKYSGYHTDEERNSQFIVATAIPVQMPSILNGAPRPLYNMKMQSRSFPELSEAGTNKTVKQVNENNNNNNNNRTTFDGNNIRPSRLPVTTTRFPSMEQRSDIKNGQSNDNPYQSFSVQKITKNNSIINQSRSNSKNYVKDSHGNNTLFKQSSLEESHLQTSNVSSSDLSNINSKRFYGTKSDMIRTTVHSSTVKSHTISNKYQQTETQAQLENVERPNSENKGSTRSLISGTSKGIYKSNSNVSGISHNGDLVMTSDITSSDSDTSTPTRVIGNSNTILNIQMVENMMQQTSTPLSRPQSVAANLAFHRQESADILSRPKTAAIISYDDLPIKSRSPSRDNLDEISMKSKSRPQSRSSSRPPSRSSSRPPSRSSSRPPSRSSSRPPSRSAFDDELPIRSRVPSRESVIPFEDMPIKSRASSRENLSRSPFHRIETPTPNDIDDISSNSIGTRSDTDEDYDENSARLRSNVQSTNDINSETYTPKSNRTTKSFASSIGSEMQDLSPTDEVDFMHQREDDIKPATKSPIRKFKPVVFRSKKIAPIKSTPPKTKTNNEIRKFDRPREALNICLNQLESTSWEVTITGLQGFVRLIRYHPEFIEAQIHVFTVSLAKQVKNLRSQVARAACQAATEFFITHRKALELESEDLVANLLNRTADTNKFLRADATRALEAMCDNLSPGKVINILTLRGTIHPNAIVRTTSAKLLNRLVSRLGCDKVFSLNKECRDKLILNGANLLQEGSLETRNYAKEMFRQLSMHSSYNKLIMDVIPTRVYRNIEKTLKSIR